MAPQGFARRPVRLLGEEEATGAGVEEGRSRRRSRKGIGVPSVCLWRCGRSRERGGAGFTFCKETVAGLRGNRKGRNRREDTVDRQ